MGVRRAVETTLEMVHQETQAIATYGPLIHNPQVLEVLNEQGIKTLHEMPEHIEGTVIIRAHGVPPASKEQLQKAGATVKDATCPRVVKVQAIINKWRNQGYATLIIGDRNHAEVEGLMGYAGDRGQVVSNEADVEALRLDGPYIIVSQTTQDRETFARLSGLILDRFPGGEVFETICDSTRKRQEEVIALSAKVDAMVVVGGRSSANTTRLGEIAESMGCKVFMAETEADLDIEGLAKYDLVGLTAGASTPTWMINRVLRTLEAIPGHGAGKLRTFLYKLAWLLLATNMIVSLGGGLLAMTGDLLQGVQPSFQHFFMAFGYLLAMHNLNRFATLNSKKFHDPFRASFYRKYRWPMLISSGAVLAAALIVSQRLGPQPFLLLSVMSVFGVLYSVKFIPRKVSALVKVRRLKEIPGSKTFFVAVAWAFVVVVIPALASKGGMDSWSFSVLFCLLLLVYVRSALFDVFEVQGDRIVGKETLPVCIGERKTIRLLYCILALLLALLVFLPVLGLMSRIGFWILPGVLYLLVLLRMYEKGRLLQGMKLELGLEMVFFLIAVLAWVGSRFS